MFSDIEITGEYIIITLADGVTKIQIPTWKSFSELAAKVAFECRCYCYQGVGRGMESERLREERDSSY